MTAYNSASNGLVEAEVKIYDQLKNMTAYNSASNGLVGKGSYDPLKYLEGRRHRPDLPRPENGKRPVSASVSIGGPVAW